MGQAAYSTAKAGIAALTLVQAAELARYGVTANAIAPAARTRMTEKVFADMMKAPEGGFDAMAPENVAPLVAWLASEDAREVTGRVFEVSGGMIARRRRVARRADGGQARAVEPEGHRRRRARAPRARGRAGESVRGVVKEACIVAAVRTPIGRANKGSLVSMRPDDLAAHAIRAALAKVPALDPRELEDVYVGCAQPAGEAGYNIARAAGLLAGLVDVPGATVNRYCASSLQAIRMAAHAIRAGEGEVFVAAGVETVSRFGKGKSDGMPETKNPRFGGAGGRGERGSPVGGVRGVKPPLCETDGLPDVYIAMGETAENVAEREKVSREQMDEFSALSQTRAVASQESGFFAEEIAPVTLPTGDVVAKDDGPRPGTTKEKLAELKPVFRETGKVTAGNACPLNDGAAAVVVMSAARAKALGIEPLARIVSTAVSALAPEMMGLGPIEASKRALARAGLTMKDIDFVEINEAFAAQVIPSARALEISWDKLNVHGGAIALGHPFGMTGARIMTTLLHTLAHHRKRYGLETLCVGGGQGMAMIVERA